MTRAMWIVAVLAMMGCATEEPSRCAELAASLASCGADQELTALCEASDPEEIDATIESSCTALNDGGKSDGLSLTGRGRGQWCVLTSQCASGLVCRSTLSFANACQPPGALGEHCWVSNHCAAGLSCHWIAAHDIPGLPLHPGRVCNPHSSSEHPHQLDGT